MVTPRSVFPHNGFNKTESAQYVPVTTEQTLSTGTCYTECI